MSLLINKIDLSKVSTKELQKVLDTRLQNARKKKLRTFRETCAQCGKTTNLKEWAHMRSYWFEDNVYTQNYRLSDDIYIICPHCLCCHDSYAKVHYTTIHCETELARYKRINAFLSNGGKFKHYYQEYSDGDRNEYYKTYELYCVEYDKNCEKLKVERPYK